MAGAHPPAGGPFLIQPLGCPEAALFSADSPVFRLFPAARAARFVINFLPPVSLTLIGHRTVIANAGPSIGRKVTISSAGPYCRVDGGQGRGPGRRRAGRRPPGDPVLASRT